MTVGMGAEAVSAQFVIGTRGRAVRPYGIWWILDHARPYVIMKLSPVFDDLPRFLILIREKFLLAREEVYG
jgi:hypothetical protein